MTYWRGAMFNRKARRGSPDLVLSGLELEPGQIVVDIGAGGGFFTFEFSRIVGPKGKVFPIDTDRKALKEISLIARNEGFSNIDAIHTEGACPSLDDKSVDLVFMRNVVHHIIDPVGYFKDLRSILKDDGRVAIIDYVGNDRFSFHSLFHHSLVIDDLIGWMGEAGFRVERTCEIPGDEFFLIFGSDRGPAFGIP